ncbi:hypothetical protein [uncultured Mediterranean phage uvMED]|nr:hypothetical protein [uncultured Mediterranean phage uvMED]|tara:strand:+ start:743 stop:1123 length:381 start_codon:yes stop_codon:yes gene_type:complete
MNVKLKNDIEKLLHLKHELRDNDNQLIAYLFKKQIVESSKVIKKYSRKADVIPEDNLFWEGIDYVIHLLSAGSLPNTESIRRIRAKLQEEKPSLRGKKYTYRRRFEKDYVKNLNNVMSSVEVANDC